MLVCSLERVLVCLSTNYQPHWLLPCSIFNLAIFASCIENICITLMCIIVCWFSVKYSHYISVRQCAVRRIVGFLVIIFFSYPLFINMMTCDKESFCPDIVASIFDPRSKSFAMERIFEYLSCRVIAFEIIYFIKSSALIMTSLCLMINWCCVDRIKKPETIELANPQSAPLPPFQNSLRLHQLTLVVIVLLSGIVSSTHAAVVYTGNLFMSLFVSLLFTLLVPLVTILLEKRILSYCLTQLADHFRN